MTTRTAKEAKRLTTRNQIDTAKPKATPYSIGGNLYLDVSSITSKQWLFIWKVAGRNRTAGFGAAGGARGRKVTLVEAQVKARAWRAIIDRGEDPRAEEAKGERFADLAETMIANLAPTWRSARTEHSWRRSLLVRSAPIADLPISTPSAELSPQIKAFLDPIRFTQWGIARKTRQALQRVFLEARAAGLRTGENPATREALGWAKAKRTKPVQHRRPLPYEAAPAFFAALDMAVKGHAGLRLLALTVTRASEVLRATAGQFELDGPRPLWTIPVAKNGKPHMIPLTADTLQFVRTLTVGLGPADLLFADYTEDTLLDAYRAMSPDYAGLDVHGFRSTFKSWAGDQTPFGRDVVEETYGHEGSENSAEAAYRQRKAMRKRRQVLTAWNAYLAGRLPLQRDDFEDETAMLAELFPNMRMAA